MVSSIPSTYSLATYEQEQRNTGSSALGKDEFLKILMTQLQNQDPLNPMEDKDFIAQMATFSSLEQMTNMNDSIERLIEQTVQTNLVSYQQFVGKEVLYHQVVENSEDTDEPTIVEGTGVITSVQYNDGEVSFELEDGTIINTGNISGINNTTSDNQILQGSELIGKTVTWIGEDETEITSIVQSVLFSNGQTTYQLDDEDGTTISASQIIKISN
ncbi:flagellar hook assembly protein FlgD [Cytobacillus sp. IB215665]|uniref:flagellar hook assembly protein FlgD n=1 Tax=Cytobacillus sp. IB215665 TaxID=3097357 RepID=UPI002A0BE5D2|nr:flagellar hook assembly protein FlgD [Cytobacillus sp. IB215665]MDX8365068.1 flagellar hook assembly protein FlgD [Cytobacillus sp. IB215665]